MTETKGASRGEPELGIPERDFLDMTETSPPRKAIYKQGITMTIKQVLGGYQILFSNGKDSLSAIFHCGSYGREQGLWEIMPPKPPKSWGDSVKGYLTFVEVLKYVNRQL